MVAALNADCALLNSGTLRSDELHKAGEFSLRVRAIFLFPADEMVTTIVLQDLLAILPMMDDLILLDVSGEMIHKVRKQSCSCSSAHTWRLSKILFLSGSFAFS